MSTMQERTAQVQPPEAPKEKLFSRQYILITLVHFVINTSFYLVTPVLTAYVVSLGATLALAGVVSGVFSFTALAVRPVSGLVTNHMPKKKLQCVASGIMGVACLCYALIPIPSLMVAFRVLQGIGFALYGTSALVTVSALIPKSRLREGIAYFGLSQVFASAVGPTVGNFVAERTGYSQSFIVAAVTMFVAMAVLALIPCPEEKREKRARGRLALDELLDVKLLKIAVFAGLFSLSNGINSSFILLLGLERGIANASMYFAVNAACVIVIRLLVSRLLTDRTVRQVLLCTLAAGAASLFLIGGARTLPLILLGAVFQAAGQGVVQPFIQAECIRRVPDARRGTASSTSLMCSDVAQGLGSMIGGWVVSVWGYSSLYFGLGAVFALLLPVVYFFLEKPARMPRAGA